MRATTQRLGQVFGEFGFDDEILVLARGAYSRFGHVASWERSAKARDAWIRRIADALHAIESELVEQPAQYSA